MTKTERQLKRMAQQIAKTQAVLNKQRDQAVKLLHQLDALTEACAAARGKYDRTCQKLNAQRRKIDALRSEWSKVMRSGR